MKMRDNKSVTGVFDGNKWPVCLGSSEFKDWVRATFFKMKTDSGEIPRAESLLPERAEIVAAVCAHYGVAETDLYVSRRGYVNEPRNVGIYLFLRLRREPLKEIGKYFHLAILLSE